MKPRVLDLYWQDPITTGTEWKAVADFGIWGVIHKATQGAHTIDRAYKQRAAQIRDAGLLLGAYHFGNNDPVEQQVDAFLNAAHPDGKTLICLDWEDHPHGQMTFEMADEWLTKVFMATGQRPVLYTGNTLKDHLDGKPNAFISQHRLWLSQYGPKAVLPPGFEDYFLWQYTGDGEGQGPHTIPGTKLKNVDLSVPGPEIDRDALAATWGIPAAQPVAVVENEPDAGHVQEPHGDALPGPAAVVQQATCSDAAPNAPVQSHLPTVASAVEAIANAARQAEAAAEAALKGIVHHS